MTFQLFRPRFLQGKSKLTGKDDLDNLRDSDLSSVKGIKDIQWENGAEKLPRPSFS